MDNAAERLFSDLVFVAESGIGLRKLFRKGFRQVFLNQNSVRGVCGKFARHNNWTAFNYVVDATLML